MKPKKVLVTGGAGFIGSHTVDLLLERGYRVSVVDNYSTGRPENLAHQSGHPRLQILQADICDIEKCAPFFEEVDWVIHLAALADIVPSIQRPLEYHHANVNGTISILELARRFKIDRFIYAASSSCYGIPDHYPTPETSKLQPQYPYALTKQVGEEYVMSWCQIYKMPAVSLRFFNVYGPRSRTSGTYGAVFGVFLAQKLNQKPFTVVGDGTQSRDFTYVTDIASAIVAAAESNVSGEIMNVGSGDHYSIQKLVELLGGKISYIPKRPGEPDVTFADTSKIKRLLNWAPKVTFTEGVSKVLDQIEYWRNAPVWTPESIKSATTDWFKYLDS